MAYAFLSCHGAELKTCLLYRNYTHKENSIPKHFEMDHILYLILFVQGHLTEDNNISKGQVTSLFLFSEMLCIKVFESVWLTLVDSGL